MLVLKKLKVKLSVKPENEKKQTIRYSKKAAMAKNSSIATKLLVAVHLKIKRFLRFSEATISHSTAIPSSLHDRLITHHT
ncbi:MAG: hypothetical protein JSW19_04370 [Candidatus Bathyarchaeota archaeon]|nr:MAG: hypothetical protein JSV75_05170 [Candidatus Bathyarchaeota archaeon]UCE57590.1 MAG: hypothetical protein JSW19_04370 [Candidatus Bathyarchaeota archaeon]